jgi:branched-chain amino acid transport system permease protein
MPSLELVITQTVNGLGVGAIYFLIAVGLTLIFGIMDFVNFAHGAFYALGAYIGFELIHDTGSFWAALVIAPLVVGVFAFVLERSLLQWAYSLDHTYQIILTFGVALVISELVIIIWSTHSQNVNPPAALQGILILGGFFFPEYRLFIIGLVAIIAVVLWLWLERTRFGAMVRAGTESLPMASAMGINVKRLFAITFSVGAGLAALGGVLVAPIGNLDPFIGDRVLGLAFAVVVVGGMGSFVGALVAALLIGVIQSLTVMLWPLGGNIIVYLFMAAVLFTQRAGLFGRSTGNA